LGQRKIEEEIALSTLKEVDKNIYLVEGKTKGVLRNVKRRTETFPVWQSGS
jgi:hypothetical protein